jgi:tetratricopeptide (TPR) repeat protein
VKVVERVIEEEPPIAQPHDVSPAPKTVTNNAAIDRQIKTNLTAVSTTSTATNAPDSASKGATDKQKPGFLTKVNPANWLKNNQKKSAPPERVELGTQTLPETKNETPVEAAIPEPGFPRYTYRQGEPPNPGNRTEATPPLNRGLAAHQQQRLADAVRFYQQAVDKDPAFFEAQINLGLASLDARDTAMALRALENALALKPHSVEARASLGSALEKAGFPIDAAAEYEKVLKAEDHNNYVRLSLANLYAQKLGKPDAAKTLYQKILEQEPAHPQSKSIRYWLSTRP